MGSSEYRGYDPLRNGILAFVTKPAIPAKPKDQT